jgi:2-methylisocitrate lyase-like PEP mutase family enzyme
VDALKQILSSVSKPVNALVAGRLRTLTVSDFAELGVRRISLGSQIARLTHRAIRDATRDMLVEGKFTNLEYSISGDEVDQLLLSGSKGENK